MTRVSSRVPAHRGQFTEDDPKPQKMPKVELHLSQPKISAGKGVRDRALLLIGFARC